MDIAVVILAAGQGTRMKSHLPKVLHPLCGRPMLHAVLELAVGLAPERIITVVGPGMEQVRESVAAVCPEALCVEQRVQCGTADAVRAALPHLQGFSGQVVVLYGDTPLIRSETVKKMMVYSHVPAHAVTVLGFYAANPMGYGRLVTGSEGELFAIVECKEATEVQRSITLCNSGVMVINGMVLENLLAMVSNHNSKGEYYLTDIVGIARKNAYQCYVVTAEEAEVLGINSRQQLAEAENIAQQRLRMQAMEQGVTLIAPDTVTFSFDTILAQDVTIHPHVVFGKNVRVEEGAEIRAFCHIEGAVVGKYSSVGPFARLRSGTAMEERSRVGNFVEIKNAQIGKGAKVNHLSYIGDATVGEKSNIGAGTITCNYDGYAKHHTTIGRNSFIGSNTAIVAPVVIGNGVIVGAGSVILEDIADNALSVARAKQVNIEGKGEAIRKRKKGEAKR